MQKYTFPISKPEEFGVNAQEVQALATRIRERGTRPSFKAVEYVAVTRNAQGELLCPDCGNHMWMLGPEAGSRQNITCTTETCESEFCYDPYSPQMSRVPS